MDDSIQNIKSLIASGHPANMDLAFELIKAMCLDAQEVLAGYRILLALDEDAPLTTDILLNAKYNLMLDLSDRGLEQLPEEIAFFEHLNSLDLSKNALKDLPDALSRLPNLQALNLASNHFVQIPEVVYQVADLQQLYISFNPITHLNTKPISLKQLSRLNRLALRGCKLTEFPVALCTRESKLFALDLGENQLQSLPAEFGQLQNLHYLQLDGNLLTALPQELNELRYLQELNLSDNFFLKELPPYLNNLKSLANLYISRTPIGNVKVVQRDCPWTEIWV